MDTIVESYKQATSVDQEVSLHDAVKQHINIFLQKCIRDNITPKDVYNLIIEEIEEPFLRSLFKYCNRNQSLTAIYLGLSRGTTRKKLKKYGLID